MLIDLDLAGRTVAVVGSPAATARARRRYAASGCAVVALATPLDALETACAIEEGRPAPDLLVDVTAGDPGWADAVSALRPHAPTTREEPAGERAGTVTLVGAGPGDPGLHTVAARDALAHADVVLVDRLAAHDERAALAALAPAARVVDVGKDPGHHRVPQGQIESFLVEEAQRGAHVVRLKGGDPFVFGRGGEEVAAVSAHGIPVRVVPGISSALAGPAAAGIPVTHRETSRSVTVLSGHDPVTPDLATHLVGVGGTVVLLMGMATLPQSVAALERAGLPADTPAAVIQEAWTTRERRLATTLDRLVADVHAHGLANPSVVVVGAVAAMAHGRTDLAAMAHGRTGLATAPQTTSPRTTTELETAR